MDYIDHISEHFPIRRKQEQKKAFRDWLMPELRRLGYAPRVEQCGVTALHENIVIGDPEHAPVLFTCHYDTPGASLLPDPRLPRNPALYLLYQIFFVLALMLGMAVVLLVLVLLFQDNTEAIRLIWMGCYVVLLLIFTFAGPANKHNANVSSGMAAMLELLASLPEEDRQKAAFIFFDDEEKAFGGSKGYARAHPQVAYTRMTVNLDCLGVGDNILLISRKLARQHPTYAPLERHLAAIQPQTAHFFDSIGGVCNTSYKQFKSGADLSACKKGIFGFYTPHLHTARDTQADSANITAVASALRDYLNELTL